MGATPFGYDLARQFGLKIITPRPGLVPLVLAPADRKRYSELAGVSTEVIAQANQTPFREKMLFTHRSLSGPAILQISSYWQEGKPIRIDLAPDRDATAAIREAGTRNLTAAEKPSNSFSPNDSRKPGCTTMRPAPGRIPRSPPSKHKCTPGRSRPPPRKASRRPKSPSAA